MGARMEYFDYISVAREGNLSDEQLRGIEEMVRRDYPDDPMLFELHVLRACNAIRDGRVTYEQVINQPTAT
jgi:hypothetical protein